MMMMMMTTTKENARSAQTTKISRPVVSRGRENGNVTCVRVCVYARARASDVNPWIPMRAGNDLRGCGSARFSRVFFFLLRLAGVAREGDFLDLGVGHARLGGKGIVIFV
jgi:hypothetical protein